MKLPFLARPLLALFGTFSTPAGDAASLEPHSTKYAQERQALADARARQIEHLRSHYVAALSAARADAAKGNRSGALVAIDAEITGTKSDVHSPGFPPDLPRILAGPRREFLSGIESMEKAIAPRIKELNTRYLQTLNSLAKNAGLEKDAAFKGVVAVEMSRILAEDTNATAPALRRNAVANGDFSKVDAGGLPTGWQPKGADYQKDNVPWQNDATVIQEGAEKFLRFRRAASVRLANVAPVATILVPDRAKAAVVSARLRVEGLVPGNNYDRFPGVSIKAFDATGKSPGSASAAATENTRWRVFTARLTLQPGAKTLDLSLGPCAAAGICDFDDVAVKFE
jgi:hypothetical protein